MLARVESWSQKICSTLTPTLSQEWKAFYAMNKLPKYTVCLSKVGPLVLYKSVELSSLF